MEKFIALIISIILVFSIVACEKTKTTDNETGLAITEEEREMLGKSYKELGDEELLVLDVIDIKVNSPDSTATKEDKENYKRLIREKEEFMKKLSETNKLSDVEKVTNQDPKAVQKSEIETAIRSRADDGDYTSTELDKITINENLGTDTPDDFVALIYFDFKVKNRRKTGNEVMRMYSDDLVATLAKRGMKNISEAAIFWKDKYNNRNVKYAYEYRDGGFYIIDIAGE